MNFRAFGFSWSDHGRMQSYTLWLGVAEVVAYNALLASLAEGTGSVCYHTSRMMRFLDAKRSNLTYPRTSLNPKPSHSILLNRDIDFSGLNRSAEPSVTYSSRQSLSWVKGSGFKVTV